MGLVTFVNVSLSFSEKRIFDEIGFHVEPRDRIGLVGSNGSGKTTLLRLITGEVRPDRGEVRVAKGVRVGYLPQDVQETLGGSLLQSVLESAPGRVKTEKARRRTEACLKKASSEEEQSALAEKLAEIHQELSRIELAFPRHGAEKILLGLGFRTADFTRPVSALSGGWKTRAALAALLYQNPDLLLLDEPTNHLDIPSVQWLETFLQGFDGAMILVSHDREFLNRQVRRTLGLAAGGLRSCNGNYDAYLKAREEERKTLEGRARRQEQRIREAEKFIERFRAKAAKARQAQSKIKLLKKMELVKTQRREKVTRFSFPEVPRSGRVVASIQGVSKGFGGNVLYKDLDLTVLRGEKIAIIGPNGCGKTTLLRMVSGEIEPDTGRVSLGHGVRVAGFAQHHSDMLDPRNTVIQEVYRVVPDKSVEFVRGVCGAFLFSGRDVDKPVGVLSGGERARVCLARLLVNPGNLMVMDEPTNHLDIASSEALIAALAEYNGTLMFVSHNQSFINRVATRIWDIRDREIIDYPGNLADYCSGSVDMRVPEAEGRRFSRNGADGRGPGKKARDRKKEKRERALRRQKIHDTLKPILSEVEILEGRIAELETRQKDLEKMLADPDIFSDKERGVPMLAEYRTVRDTLDELFVKWEQEQHRLETTRKALGLGEA